MALAPEYYTADMVRALPEDGQRYECVHGELLVTPAPRFKHQVVVSNVHFELAAYCRRHGIGLAMTSPADISWGPDNLVQPDVFVVAAAESSGRDWNDIRTLDLVAEVLSLSTAKHDRFQKRRLYQRQGVETLWLIDIDRALVEVWTPDALFPVIETERLTWHPAGAAEPLVIPLASLFGER
jgi:Uma2 family endonuclease